MKTFLPCILALTVICGVWLPLSASAEGTEGLAAEGRISLQEGQIAGTVELINHTGTQQSADVTLAVYEDGALSAIRIGRVSVPTGGAAVTQTLTLDAPTSETATVKLMVWENLFLGRPMCKAEQTSLAALRAGLSWAPPALENPTVIDFAPTGYSPKLDDNKDYILRLPPDEPRTETVRIRGGRNVVLIGGQIEIPGREASDHRAIYIEDGAPGRTVHIEGVLVACHGENEGDAIAIKAPNTIVQVENFRVENLQGAVDTDAGHNHSDIIQPWGGVLELRVDHLTGSSNYQGLFLNADYNQNGAFLLKNINLVANEKWFDGAGGGYMIWLDGKSSPPPQTELENVYVTPRSGAGLRQTVQPYDDTLVISGDGTFATWPSLTHVRGGVSLAPEDMPDFVPAGSVGLGYVSPWGDLY